jgi:hypothetical protein
LTPCFLKLVDVLLRVVAGRLDDPDTESTIASRYSA